LDLFHYYFTSFHDEKPKRFGDFTRFLPWLSEVESSPYIVTELLLKDALEQVLPCALSTWRRRISCQKGAGF